MRGLQPVPAPDPAELEPVYASACQALQAGQLPQAQALFTLLLTRAPSELRFLSGLGRVSALQGNFELAAGLYALAWHRDRSELRLLLPWAEALIGLGSNAPARFLLRALCLGGAGDAALARSVQRAQALLELLSHG